MSDAALDQLVHSLADFRVLATRLVMAKQERRAEGATPAERMSTPQHISLLALAGGPLAISDLAESTGVAVSSATRMVQGLEREGWVERATADPGGDRRRRPVGLTPAGRAVMEEASAVVRDRFRQLLTGLDPDEREAIQRGLDALTRAIVARRLAQADETATAGPSMAASNSASEGGPGDSADAPAGRIPSRITPR